MSNLECRVCCKSVYTPFRQYDDKGKITLGCVCSDHDGYLTPSSESAYWHNRKEAKDIRKMEIF